MGQCVSKRVFNMRAYWKTDTGAGNGGGSGGSGDHLQDVDLGSLSMVLMHPYSGALPTGASNLNYCTAEMSEFMPYITDRDTEDQETGETIPAGSHILSFREPSGDNDVWRFLYPYGSALVLDFLVQARANSSVPYCYNITGFNSDGEAYTSRGDLTIFFLCRLYLNPGGIERRMPPISEIWNAPLNSTTLTPYIGDGHGDGIVDEGGGGGSGGSGGSGGTGSAWWKFNRHWMQQQAVSSELVSPAITIGGVNYELETVYQPSGQAAYAVPPPTFTQTDSIRGTDLYDGLIYPNMSSLGTVTNTSGTQLEVWPPLDCQLFTQIPDYGDYFVSFNGQTIYPLDYLYGPEQGSTWYHYFKSIPNGRYAGWQLQSMSIAVVAMWGAAWYPLLYGMGITGNSTFEFPIFYPLGSYGSGGYG